MSGGPDSPENALIAKPPVSRGMGVSGLGFMALTIALGLLATLKVGFPAERSVLKAVAFREHVTGDFLIAVVQWVSWLGEPAQRSLAMVGFAALLYWRKRPWAALVMVIAPPVAGATSSLLKEIFSRARPEVVPHLDMVTSLSFPSGHATNVMAIYLLAALLLAQARRPLWIGLALLMAAAIGTSRLLLGVHWPSDVLGGWCWGTGIAILGARISHRKESAQKAKRNPTLMSRPESGA
jgi:undecaprenyl-diphosphatase